MWAYQHQKFKVYQIPTLNDNYVYVIAAHDSSCVLVIDPAVAAPVISACDTLKLTPTHILNTHHHWDHTDGNQALVKAYGCEVLGNQADAVRIPCLSMPVQAPSHTTLGSLHIQVLDVPGHTIGHIAFVIDDALFCGDTLFGAGCGRLFEGSPAQMWDSLRQLAELPDSTQVYCAHEYTLPNLRFAKSVDANNPALQQRIRKDTQTRMQQQPTIPSSIGLEKETNPFLRPLNQAFVQAYNQTHQSDFDALQIFTWLREAKNKW